MRKRDGRRAEEAEEERDGVRVGERERALEVYIIVGKRGKKESKKERDVEL